MKTSIGQSVFPGAGRFCRSSALLLTLAAAGCNTVGEAQPVAGAQNTGTFPNLNIVPKPAASQLTEEQKNAKLAALAAEKNAQASSGGKHTPANKAELDRLARNQGKDTLAEIERKCDATLDPNCK